jgi:hypothetical protein
MESEVTDTVRVIRSHPVQYQVKLQSREYDTQHRGMRLLLGSRRLSRKQSPSSIRHPIPYISLHTPDFSAKLILMNLNNSPKRMEVHSRSLAGKIEIESKLQFSNLSGYCSRNKSIFEFLDSSHQQELQELRTERMEGAEVVN